jgi:hypothetical protein
LTAVLALSSSAPAQDRDPTPQELWNAYPLDPPRTGVAVELPSPTPSATTPASKSDGGPPIVLIGSLIGAAFAVGLFIGARRRRVPESGSRSAPAAPPPVEAAHVAAAAPVATSPPPPAAPPEPPAPRTRRFRPRRPIPDGAWSCDITWRNGLRGPQFRAIARVPGTEGRRTQIARSPTIDWPPILPATADPELVRYVRALVGALMQAGWQATDRGEPWYSQRFVWEGSEAPEPLGEIAPSEVVKHG